MMPKYLHSIFKTVLLVFFFLQPILCIGQNKYAVLIGIGDYPSDSGWNKIHGDNDVSIIKTNLLGQGFDADNIDILINASATKSAILLSFENLCDKVLKDDVIYIHFSGHGQQITDLNGDEDDEYDEAWIPFDARKSYEAGVYEGENHLIDDELNEIFTRLRVRIGAKGKIVVVADACHSGSGSRGIHSDNSEAYVRGTGDKFVMPQGKPNIIRKQESVEWLFVAACKPYQTNYEYKADNGSYYGALSYIIANDGREFVTNKYVDVLKDWNVEMQNIVRYPQTMDNDGQPSRRSVYLF